MSRLVLAGVLLALNASASHGQSLSGPRPVSCRDEIGSAATKRLAAQCRDASPATHPPCNVANPCAMMREEIARSCQLFANSSPLPADLCAADRTP